jgi:hypothetical protein
VIEQLRYIELWWRQLWCKHEPKRIVDLVDIQSVGSKDGRSVYSGIIEHHHYECVKCGKEGKTEDL